MLTYNVSWKGYSYNLSLWTTRKWNQKCYVFPFSYFSSSYEVKLVDGDSLSFISGSRMVSFRSTIAFWRRSERSRTVFIPLDREATESWGITTSIIWRLLTLTFKITGMFYHGNRLAPDLSPIQNHSRFMRIPRKSTRYNFFQLSQYKSIASFQARFQSNHAFKVPDLFRKLHGLSLFIFFQISLWHSFLWRNEKK